MRDDPRVVMISLRISPDERATLEHARGELTLSEYIRLRLFGGERTWR